MVSHIWGWPIKYTEHHIPEDQLVKMRFEIDTAGDAGLEGLICQLPELSSCRPGKFASLLQQEVKDSSLSENDERIKKFMEEVMTDPEWLDRDLLKQGQNLFLKYSSSAMMALLYFSLIGGFSAPALIKVLDKTGYLTKQSRDATFRRLNETLEMVVDCVSGDDSLDVNGVGWLAVLKVRLLHSRVRRRILSMTKEHTWKKNEHSTFPDGLPINQEDMCATLLSFSANVIETIERIGAPFLTMQEQEAYIHLWRYIGFLIGIKEEHNPCTSVNRARGAIECMVMHLLRPNDRSVAVVDHVLRAVCHRKPISSWTYELHAEIARALLGDPLSDALQIRRGSVGQWLYASPWVSEKTEMGRGLIRGVRKKLKFAVAMALKDSP